MFHRRKGPKTVVVRHYQAVRPGCHYQSIHFPVTISKYRCVVYKTRGIAQRFPNGTCSVHHDPFAAPRDTARAAFSRLLQSRKPRAYGRSRHYRCLSCRRHLVRRAIQTQTSSRSKTTFWAAGPRPGGPSRCPSFRRKPARSRLSERRRWPTAEASSFFRWSSDICWRAW